MHLITGAITYIILFFALYVEIFLFITYFEMKEEKKTATKKVINRLPSVSIMVPCWNESATIGATVESLLSLDYPKNKLFIYIIDDGSTDDTWLTMQQYANNPQIKLIQKENGGKASALNYCLTLIDTEMVGCLDADSFVGRDTLKMLVAEFDDDIMAVTPSIKIHNPKKIIELMQKVEYGWGILFRHILSRLGAIYVTPGPFSIFRKEVFNKLGGYREAHKTEDLELALRMQSAGMKIANSPKAFVYTVAPQNIKSLYKQRLRWTYGFIKNMLDYKRMLLNPKYGNLGLIVLPAAGFSIFSSIYIAVSSLINYGIQISNKFVELSTVGINWNWQPVWDMFYVNTTIIGFIGLIGFIGTLVMVLISRNLAEDDVRPGLDVLYFLTIYIFLIPLWMSKAVYNVVFAKETNWR
jgi:cellulose synthase/poly-beta-1,6-N-acetylglucosamine synthase-like glycosyltransferase